MAGITLPLRCVSMKDPVEFRQSQYPESSLYLWPEQGYWFVASQGFWDDFKLSLVNWCEPISPEVLDLRKELGKRGIIDINVTDEAEFPSPIYFCPTKFVVSTTDICNLNCPYCYASSGIKNSNRIDDRTFQEALAFVVAYHGVEIKRKHFKVSFVGGEPLLHPRLPYFIRAAHESGLIPSVTTNASLSLSKELVSSIIDCNCEVNVSLDGPTQEIHSATRQSSFNSIMRFAKDLIERGSSVTATCVVHAGNIAHLERLISVCYEAGYCAVNFNTLNRMGRGAELSGLQPVLRTELLLELFRICDSKPELMKYLSHSAFFSKLFALSRGMSQRDCGLCNECFFLDANGQMFLCGALKLKELEIEYRKLAEISVLRKKLETIISSYAVENLPDCAGCDFRYFCAGDCRGEALAVNGSAFGRHPACEDIKKSLIQMMFALATGKYEV